MKSYIALCVVCLQLDWSYGAPSGVGAFAYQDSSGNRYGGTYPINDGQYFGLQQPPFQIPYVQNYYQDLDTFFPEYFRNFESILQEAFNRNIANQRIALEAARKAFDLTSNQAGYDNNLPFRSPFGDFSFPTFDMSFPNSAYAGGAVGPGFNHQVASINPENPRKPNINVMNRFADTPQPPGSNFVSMSSKAYSVSSNVNGKEFSDRGAVTTLNDNGKITTYSVNS